MQGIRFIKILFWLALFFSGMKTVLHAQVNTNSNEKVKKASRKIESGYTKDNRDTLAQGYYELGESFYQKGELAKSETYYGKAKSLFEKNQDPAGIAKSSRGLAKVQEDLHKEKEAVSNYIDARDNYFKTGDETANTLNENDILRLSNPDSLQLQEALLLQNIKLGRIRNDTSEIISNFSRMADINLQFKNKTTAVDAYTQAYQFSKKNPEQAMHFNQRITDVYLQDRNYPKAIETKNELLKEDFIKKSTQLNAREITSLAGIYLLKNEDSTAVHLLEECYELSVKNGHTLEAKACIEKLDSIFRRTGRKELSLVLFRDFLVRLPDMISKDSSIADNRLINETGLRITELENEKTLKDDVIRRKNIFSYWLIGSLALMGLFILAILLILRKLRTRNKKIALQSLRREMNPHFIFNSLNSINQFIANNNEQEANRYLTKFSTLMRRVMENSKDDFVLFSKEMELLKSYLELEKSRFPDQFDFTISLDDELTGDENLYLPGMLIQPHLENAIWHGLRYIENKGLLQLIFRKTEKGMHIIIDDNGIGIAESERNKTGNQKQRSGRGISNTLERIRILNELYQEKITCQVEDKRPPENGVRVSLFVPLLKNYKA